MGVGRAQVKDGGADEWPSRVSVIVPARNAANSLEFLLHGLSDQVYRDFEVMLIDDGSSDETSQVAERARQDGVNLHYIRTEGVGAVAARCAGIEKAAGEILAFTDSDCIPDPEWLAEGVKAVDAGADVVQGRTVPQRAVGPLERSISYSGGAGLFATCNVFYRRSAYDAVGGFDRTAGERLGFRPTAASRGLGFGEDTLLGWAVERVGRSAYAPDAVVRHEVVRPPVSETVYRAWMAGAFPALVREAPELRRTLLRNRVLLGGLGWRHLVYAILISAAAELAGAPPAAARGTAGALGVAWVAGRAWRAARLRGPRKDRALALAVDLTTDVVTCATLLAGSVRGRRMVL